MDDNKWCPVGDFENGGGLLNTCPGGQEHIIEASPGGQNTIGVRLK